MTQLEIYQEALYAMRYANYVYESPGNFYWEIEYMSKYLVDHLIEFTGLCQLIIEIEFIDGIKANAKDRFVVDSERVLRKELLRHTYWFTSLDVDEAKARSERVNHLERLIKMYKYETII